MVTVDMNLLVTHVMEMEKLNAHAIHVVVMEESTSVVVGSRSICFIIG